MSKTEMDCTSVVLDIGYKIQLYFNTVESRATNNGQEISPIGCVSKFTSSL